MFSSPKTVAGFFLGHSPSCDIEAVEHTSVAPGKQCDGDRCRSVASLHDIIKRKKTEKEREKLIIELGEALKNIQTLSGLLPICAHCKKIRDDNNYEIVSGRGLPPHLRRIHVNARIQKWMLDELKQQGEVGIVLEYILEKKAGFKYQPDKQNRLI